MCRMSDSSLWTCWQLIVWMALCVFLLLVKKCMYPLEDEIYNFVHNNCVILEFIICMTSSPPVLSQKHKIDLEEYWIIFTKKGWNTSYYYLYMVATFSSFVTNMFVVFVMLARKEIQDFYLTNEWSNCWWIMVSLSCHYYAVAGIIVTK